MTRVIRSKYKSNRRLLVNLWGSQKSSYLKRKYRPGQHGQRRSKVSDYGQQLRAKQMLRFYHNISEKQFKGIYQAAMKARGNTGDNIINLLERRLDTVIYRLRLAPTLFSAAQLVSHGHVEVNNKVVNIRSYRLKDEDQIKLRPSLKENLVIMQAIKQEDRIVPSYLEVDHDKLEGKFLRKPAVNEVPYPINMDLNLVIGFYSRS